MNKRIFLNLFIMIALLIAFTACAGTENGSNNETAGPVQEQPADSAQTESSDMQDTPVPETHEPVVITEQDREDVRAFIQRLNGIIGRREYARWLENLTQSFIDYYSNPEYLASVTAQLHSRGYRTTVRNLKDYFDNVVVLSRQGAQMEDLAYDQTTGTYQVYGTLQGLSGILYDLENQNGVWKITSTE